jgi:hypothetical protein
MNYIDKKLEEFDEKFPNPIYDETEIGDDSETNRKLKSFLKQALEEQEEEIVEWLKKRCQSNIQSFGTDKWNSDLEDLIKKLK